MALTVKSGGPVTLDVGRTDGGQGAGPLVAFLAGPGQVEADVRTVQAGGAEAGMDHQSGAPRRPPLFRQRNGIPFHNQVHIQVGAFQEEVTDAAAYQIQAEASTAGRLHAHGQGGGHGRRNARQELLDQGAVGHARAGM
jgi:hypothetical protein